jgi:hypothetical protein
MKKVWLTDRGELKNGNCEDLTPDWINGYACPMDQSEGGCDCGAYCAWFDIEDGHVTCKGYKIGKLVKPPKEIEKHYSVKHTMTMRML